MDSTTLQSYFTTTRDFTKYVVNEDRILSEVPPFQIPVDYSPNSGLRLGILVEPESENLFPDSENLQTGVNRSSNVSIRNDSIAGSDVSARFPSGRSNSWIGCSVPNIETEYVAVSFYMAQGDLQRPTVGYGGNSQTSVTIRVNDSEINIAASDIDVQGPMNDLSYRVRVRAIVPGGVLSDVKIYKTEQQQYSLNVARVQVERDIWTSYIPTTGSPEQRPEETIYRDIVDGIDFNNTQGTFDVAFSATPGARGAPFTLRSDDWGEWISAGLQYDDDDSPQITSFSSESGQFNDLSHDDTDYRVREKYAAIRFCYSGYGVRSILAPGGDLSQSGIGKLKDFDSFRDGEFTRLQFGETYNGDHFAGHIHLINAYARTFNDEEMRSYRFDVGDQSRPIDDDLEAPTINITAAALFRTDLEAELYQDVIEPPTPERILAAWPRATSGTYFSDPSTASGGNVNEWFFDDQRYSFVQPINSPTMEQIFSPIKLDNYEFECVLTSNAGDDDTIGIVLAADYIDGELLSIVAGVQYGGAQLRDNNNNHWNFTLAFLDNTTTYTGGHRVNTEVLGANNAMGGNRVPNSGDGGGWGGKEVKIRAIRQGTFLSVVVSEWDGEDYLPSSEIVYNMQNLPRNGYKLLGPARYGFMTLSQADSTYLDYNIKSDRVINDLKIYSEESNSFWYFVNGEWTLQQETAATDLLPSTRINNRVTKEQFLIDENTSEISFNRNNGVDYGDAEVEVDQNSTTDIPVSDIIDQFNFDEDLFLFNIYEEDNLIAEQVVIDGDQFVRVVSEGSNGSFIVLIGTEPETDAFGVRDETIAFRTVNVVVS